MNPIEAAILSGELTAVMDRLSTLDLHPIDNGADIDAMRAEAIAIVDTLKGYLLVSDNFTPVVEAADVVTL